MITRRATLIGIGATFALPRIALATQSPQPSIFMSEAMNRYVCHNGQTFGAFLRADFMRRMQDKLIPTERTSETRHQVLRARYTFEPAYIGIEFSAAIVAEAVAEVEHMSAYRLVALDGFPLIDQATFQPCIGFYADYNP